MRVSVFTIKMILTNLCVLKIQNMLELMLIFTDPTSRQQTEDVIRSHNYCGSSFAYEIVVPNKASVSSGIKRDTSPFNVIGELLLRRKTLLKQCSIIF